MEGRPGSYKEEAVEGKNHVFQERQTQCQASAILGPGQVSGWYQVSSPKSALSGGGVSLS